MPRPLVGGGSGQRHAGSEPDRTAIIRARLQDRETLIQAMITREILDKPLALRRGRR